MHFISIGPYCHTALILKEHNLRLQAYPFDYIYSSLEMVKHCINDKFNTFLDKKYFISGSHPHVTRHSFYCKFLDTPLLRRHFSTYCKESNIEFNTSIINLFNHHKLIEQPHNHEKFKRRCNRLLDLIDSNEKIVFVYYNCYISEFDDIIEFSNNFSNNKNIYILGIFEVNSDKKILYENTNCKIYQNYDIPTIFNEIKSSF